MNNLLEVFKTMSNLSFESGIEVLNKHFDTNNGYSNEDGDIYDNYIVSFDDNNWICYTSEIIERPVDDEMLLGSGSWNCCFEGEMYYKDYK